MWRQQLSLAQFDSELWQVIQSEQQRQEDHIELIASENYTSPSVMQVQGSVLTNKYAEGYPHKRYYGGCEYVDLAEDLAIDRAKQLFQADYANVQPHSGSQANAAVYMALLNPGDCILAMDLSHGGHLTHGSKVNFSGITYHAEHYGVDAQSGLIDYDCLADLAKQHRPKLLVGGFSAYSRTIDWATMRDIADSVGAYLLADMAHIAGLVAVGLSPSPVPHADAVTTTTHKTLRGPRGGLILARQSELHKKFNSGIFPGQQGGPLMHVIAAKAVAFKEAMQPEFRDYQQQVIRNAKAMADEVMARGYQVVSGGTDNHMFLIDLSDKTMTGKEAESALDQAFLTVNKNTVPGEKRSPFVTSGLRIGSPAMTTRGCRETEAKLIAGWICDILDRMGSESTIAKVRTEVQALCREFPVYQEPHAVTRAVS